MDGRTAARLLALVALAPAGCGPAHRLGLPPRPPGAMSGSEFARSVEGLDRAARDERIVAEILGGNVPSWLRGLRPVRVGGGGGVAIELEVLPDYLAVGSDTDYLYVPMAPGAAQRIADSLGMSLPTPTIVDAIWDQAGVRLAPSPIAPSPEMTTVPVFVAHSRAVREQRMRAGVSLGALVAGHKKDVVVAPGLAARPGRVAIYGWHELDGTPIQPLYLGHTDDWVDYSHGVRLVRREVRVDGVSMDLRDVLRDPALAALLSREGPIDRPWYPPGRGDAPPGRLRPDAGAPPRASRPPGPDWSPPVRDPRPSTYSVEEEP